MSGLDLARRVRACTPAEFPDLALAVFEYQRQHNPTYRHWLELTRKRDATPTSWRAIPCMPIGLFRTHDVRTGDWVAETSFSSSGTSGAQTSHHPVCSLVDYQDACVATFEEQYGPLAGYRLLALLPSYLERTGSGLVAMVDAFIARAAAGSGYYLHDYAGLRQNIAEAGDRPVMLWGVSFALLDLVAAGELVLPKGSRVIETGGMKGRRRELTREELHSRLRAGIRDVVGAPLPIGSEYGMTEMSSQAYLDARGLFRPAHTLRVQARELSDPYALRPAGKSGALNVYDLANVRTASFLQTDDLGAAYEDGSFTVLGRADVALARGCNLLYTDAADDAAPTERRRA